MSEENEKEFSELVSEYKANEAELNSMKERYSLVTTTLNEAKGTVQSLQALDEAPEDTEFLFPLGTGVKMPVNIQKDKKVIISLGSDISMGASVSDAIGSLEDKIEVLSGTKEKLGSDLRELSVKMEEQGAKIEQLYSQRGSQQE